MESEGHVSFTASELASTQALVLVIDHVDANRDALCGALRGAGMLVIDTHGGVTGMTALRERHPDIIILNLDIPDLIGLDVLRRIVRTTSVPVLTLSAHTDLATTLTALNTGASGFVPLPAAPAELVARTRAQLRRMPSGSEVLRVENLELRPSKRLASCDGRPLPLTALEFDLLVFLARKPRRIFTRDEIARQVWGQDVRCGGNTIDVHVASLRAKLSAAGAANPVRTVRGIGYGLNIQTLDQRGA
ncbi:response regulator transcription factor [Deinococcus soli (ex Cha et al. 2016)]|nr:response regulator transcription factor [Deinococcus soli (ex Cha et al. 2016)]